MTQTTRENQAFLDSAQYQQASILQYEAVYGEDFVSPGGAALARELIAQLHLQPGARVLDVGCGLGGGAFVMARDFGLRADGIDLSRNMIALAERKLAANGLAHRVELRWGDCLELDCPGRYDAAYSRDVFLHIDDKARLFQVLNGILKAEGLLLFSDYCCGPKPWSEEFAAYVRSRNYTLHTVDEYADLIAAAGFERVEANDATARFIELLRAELQKIESLELAHAEREKLAQSWRQKIERAEAGDQRWGLFSAVKGD